MSPRDFSTDTVEMTMLVTGSRDCGGGDRAQESAPSSEPRITVSQREDTKRRVTPESTHQATDPPHRRLEGHACARLLRRASHVTRRCKVGQHLAMVEDDEAML